LGTCWLTLLRAFRRLGPREEGEPVMTPVTA